MNLEAQTREYREFIEAYLTENIAAWPMEPQKELFDAMRYSLLAGGKRLRPILVFEFCQMCGGDWKKAAPFAAAVEMIHTYSLIHDDLPAMDNDDLRRGKPTNHKVYGEALAILAGDALLTDAFLTASSMSLPDPTQMSLAISVLAHCSGSMGMVGGQVLDIRAEDRVCTEEEVIAIQTRKTGALLNAACVLGVIAAGGSEDQLACAGGFAGLMGLAFQIRDDILDVIGTQEEMGKGVGTDENKNTFVRLYGLEKCEEMVRQYTDMAISMLTAFDDTSFIAAFAKSLTERRS